MKTWARSKTIWFSVALAIFGAVEANFSVLDEVLGKKAYGIAFIVISIITAVLRFYSATPLGGNDADHEKS